MKKILFAALMTVFLLSTAQTSPGVTTSKSPPKTLEQITKGCVKTTLLFDNNAVWKTPSEKYFIVVTSKKGNLYKKYVRYNPPTNSPTAKNYINPEINKCFLFPPRE